VRKCEATLTELLLVSDLSKTFGGVKAVRQLSFSISKGDIKALVGPNGAGKTTALNMISRLLKPDSGKIMFAGRSLGAEPSHALAGLGIARTFQTSQVFPSLSVVENVMIGGHSKGAAGFFSAMINTRSVAKEEKLLAEKARSALELVGMSEAAETPVSALSYGSVRLVEMARALVSDPKLIVMDEPAAGLNDRETEDLGTLLKSLKSLGQTILLVEHHMPMVMRVSDSIVVMNYGQKLAEGPPIEIARNPAVIEAYLGTERL